MLLILFTEWLNFVQPCRDHNTFPCFHSYDFKIFYFLNAFHYCLKTKDSHDRKTKLLFWNVIELDPFSVLKLEFFLHEIHTPVVNLQDNASKMATKVTQLSQDRNKWNLHFHYGCLKLNPVVMCTFVIFGWLCWPPPCSCVYSQFRRWRQARVSRTDERFSWLCCWKRRWGRNWWQLSDGIVGQRRTTRSSRCYRSRAVGVL